jgi:hypothetical protein
VALPSEVEKDPNLSIPFYLMSIYLYGECATSVLCDLDYDDLCKFIDYEWENLQHIHKQLVIRESLADATTAGYDLKKLPNRIKNAAITWAKENKKM